MKKKLLALALCICTAFSAVACDDATNDETKTEGKITLGEYKGIKVDASLKEVAEEDLQNYLDSVLESQSYTEEVKEGAVTKEDTVKIDCKIFVDDKEYKAVTGETMTLGVAAGTMSSGFPIGDLCAGIVGKNVGDEYELNLKYGDDYTDSTVAGKAAIFKIKITAKVNTIIPEFTDEFVATTFDYLGLSTKDDLVAYLENDIVINQVYADIWQNVVFKNATVDSYDSEDLETMTEEYLNYWEYYIYQNSGGTMTLDAYLEKNEVSKEDFEKNMEEMAKAQLKQEMLIEAIAEAENIVVTDEIYAAEMLEMAKSYGYETAEEFEEAYKDSTTKEDFEFTILTYMIQEYVCTNVEFVEGQGLYTEVESESGTQQSTSSTEENTTAGSTEETTTSAE